MKESEDSYYNTDKQKT